MAGWSSFNHGSCSYIDVKVEYIDECEERLKKLFDQALLVFLEEEANRKPLPVTLGDGENVDLFKLFVLVWERQGFDSVSRNGLWDLVAAKLGLDCSVSPFLRLVYSKYLIQMEKWAVEKSRIVNWDDRDGRKKGCYGGLLHELGNGFKGLLENGKCQKRNRALVLSCTDIIESHHRKRFRRSSYDDDDDHDDERVGTSCVVVSDDESEEEGLDLAAKRQGDLLPDMLKWLTSVAISPHDPSIGVIPHCSKWKEYTGNECCIKAIKAKNALLVQRDNVNYCQLLGYQTVHPSMYDDDRKSLGRLRYKIRSPKLSKHYSSSCYDGSLVSVTKSRSSSCRDLVAGTSRATDLQVLNKPLFPRRNAAVGARYQARVEEWKESGLESDTKWLGTRVWPLDNNETVEDLVGKGRTESCSCDTLISNSVECIRFHIAEKRMELKRDLGDVFFHWRFNQMGEEVSLRWTEGEEKRFKVMIISDPHSFWKNAARYFPRKKREQLVHYYFNVYLINRRRYQNRVTPRHLDSDDDSESFGSVGGSFGSGAVTSFGSDIMICSQNRQCEDFD